MRIRYSFHARLRMKQRGITSLEVEHVLAYPMYTKFFGKRKEVGGMIKNTFLRIKFVEGENHIKVVTLMIK